MIHSVNWIHLIHSTWLLLCLLGVFIVRVFYSYCYSSSKSPQSRMKTVIFTLLYNTCFCITGFMVFSFFAVFFLYLRNFPWLCFVAEWCSDVMVLSITAHLKLWISTFCTFHHKNHSEHPGCRNKLPLKHRAVLEKYWQLVISRVCYESLIESCCHHDGTCPGAPPPSMLLIRLNCDDVYSSMLSHWVWECVNLKLNYTLQAHLPVKNRDFKKTASVTC